MTGSGRWWGRLTALALVAVVAGCSAGERADGGADGAGRVSEAAVDFRGSGFAACPAAVGAVPSGSALAGIALPCMDGSGRTAAPGAPTGRPVVLNLWGSWCPPCGKELPVFVRLAERAGDRVTVLGVNTSDSGRNAVAAARDLDVAFANVYDRGGQVQRALRIRALPATVFLDARGRVVHVHDRSALDDAALADLLDRHLGVTVR